MFTGFQVADSSSTRVVVSRTSVSKPPMTPAMESAPRVSATTTVSSSSTRVSPSRVVRVSPGSALRVMMVGGPPARSTKRS